MATYGMPMHAPIQGAIPSTILPSSDTAHLRTPLNHKTLLWVGAAAAAAHLLILLPLHMVVQAAAVLLLGGFGALFGAFTSGVLIGSSTPNVHLRQFEADFEAGRLVLILDVPKQRVDELGALVKSHFPFIRDYQVDATIPAFP